MASGVCALPHNTHECNHADSEVKAHPSGTVKATFLLTKQLAVFPPSHLEKGPESRVCAYVSLQVIILL